MSTTAHAADYESSNEANSEYAAACTQGQTAQQTVPDGTDGPADLTEETAVPPSQPVTSEDGPTDLNAVSYATPERSRPETRTGFRANPCTNAANRSSTDATTAGVRITTDCTGQAGVPHMSTWASNRNRKAVSAQAWTYCNTAKPYMFAKANLVVYTFYGSRGVAEGSDAHQRANGGSKKKVEANAAIACSSPGHYNQYGNNASHVIRLSNGSYAYGTTHADTQGTVNRGPLRC